MLTQPLGVGDFVSDYPFAIGQGTTPNRQLSGSGTFIQVMEVDPYDVKPIALKIPSVGIVGGPLGAVGFAELFQSQVLRAVALPTERFVHAPQSINTSTTDTPVEVHIPNRLVGNNIRIGRELPDTGDRLGAFVADTSAVLVLDGEDGSLDYILTNQIWRDRPARIKVGFAERTAGGSAFAVPPMSQFISAFEGRVLNLEIDDDGQIRVQVTDGWQRLDRPIQSTTYTGAGDRYGGPDLEGVPVPLCYGTCPNVTPVWVDAARGIGQVHDGEAFSIVAKDMGVPLQHVGDVATYAELKALTTQGEGTSEEGETVIGDDREDIILGQYATCRKEGFMRVAGGVRITCDVQGDGLYDGPITFKNGVLFKGGVGWKAPGSRTHRRYPGGIIYRILFSRGALSDRELDLQRFIQFDENYPYEAGIAIFGDRPTVREVCTRVADSAGAVVLRNLLGQVTMRALTGPAVSSQIILDDRDLAEKIQRVALPWGSPWPRIEYNYAPNWTVLTDDQISDQITDETQLAALKREFQQTSAMDPDLSILLPDRPALTISSVLRREAHATEVAKRMVEFYKYAPALYRLVVDNRNFRMDVLSTVIVRVSRFGLQGGQPMLVLGVQEFPGERRTELMLMPGPPIEVGLLDELVTAPPSTEIDVVGPVSVTFKKITALAFSQLVPSGPAMVTHRKITAEAVGEVTEETTAGVPSYIGANSGVYSVGSTINLVYPTCIEDDLLILQVGTSTLTTLNTVTTPTNWTLKHALEGATEGTAADAQQAIYYRFVPPGGLTGTFAVAHTTPETNGACYFRIYVYRGVNATTPFEGGQFLTSAPITTIVSMPAVTTGGPNRRAVTFVTGSGNFAISEASGASGGTWSLETADYHTSNGYNAVIAAYGAPMASAGTISGGSATMAGSASWAVRGFALRPA